jgi:L-lactate dehydrogenase complex protein LldG
MTSKEYILQRIQQNKPEQSLLPDVPAFERNDVDLVAHFKETLAFVGGQAIELENDDELNSRIQELYPDMKVIASEIGAVKAANFDLQAITDPHLLRDIDLVVIRGEFGVSENAAVWVPSSALSHRVLPFITQHAVIVLDKSQLVWNMHLAYKRLDISKANGFGAFISGPSKTADIEQSLVIGAHGSRSLVVFLMNR